MFNVLDVIFYVPYSNFNPGYYVAQLISSNYFKINYLISPVTFVPFDIGYFVHSQTISADFISIINLNITEMIIYGLLDAYKRPT